jgi:hypothetical protein
METRQQRLIRLALEHGSGADRGGVKQDGTFKPEAPESSSLRDQALRHTDADYVPRTLTPHEWETYYERVGVPRSHRRVAIASDQCESGGILGRLLRRLLPGKA